MEIVAPGMELHFPKTASANLHLGAIDFMLLLHNP